MPVQPDQEPGQPGADARSARRGPANPAPVRFKWRLFILATTAWRRRYRPLASLSGLVAVPG